MENIGIKPQKPSLIFKIHTMKTRTKRSKAMTITNALVRKGWTFGDAQRQAWKVVNAIEEMQKDEIVIRFYKDGEEIPEQRTAKAVNSTNYNHKGTSRKTNPLQITYFDTCKNPVRSFSAERFDGYKAAA